MDILTKAEINELEQQIKADAAAAPQNIKEIFCKGWPAAKLVLEALVKIIKNPVAKVVLQTVITIGDAAHKAICP